MSAWSSVLGNIWRREREWEERRRKEEGGREGGHI